MFIFNTEVIPPSALAEEMQKSEIKYAFCKKKTDSKYINITSWIACRDFLTDCLFIQNLSKKQNQKINFEVYHFEYSSNPNNILDTIAIISPKDLDLYSIKSSINNTINLLECSLYPNFPQTFSFLAKNNLTGLPVLVIKISPLWFTNTYIFSIFTLLLRLFTYKKNFSNIWKNILDQKEPNNDNYLVQLLLKDKYLINKLLLNLDKNLPDPCINNIITINNVDITKYTIHEKSGILAGLYDKTFTNFLNDLKDPPYSQKIANIILFD